MLVTEATAAVHALNARARAERILAGDTHDGRDVELSDGARASVGDIVITRRNDRRLCIPRGGWVHNGERWKVTDVRHDGSLTVQRMAHRRAARTVLPPDYVRNHVDLGYAVTAHRAQGTTVDTAHVVASGSTTRENLYVSMTRGRTSNIAYVALDTPDDSHAGPEPDDVTARTVLYGVLQHSGAELSAHQTITAEQEAASSIAQLAAEYETLAAAAQRDRWIGLLQRSGLTPGQVTDVAGSTAFGPLASELRRLEVNGYDVGLILPKVIGQHSLRDAADLGAVIRYRLTCLSTPRGRTREGDPARLIAGLIPAALGLLEEEFRLALDERAELMTQRARGLAERALEEGSIWVQRMGESPAECRDRGRWMDDLIAVAAYRERYSVTTAHPLGNSAASEAQRRDRHIAAAALRSARRLTASAGSPAPAPWVQERSSIA